VKSTENGLKKKKNNIKQRSKMKQKNKEKRLQVRIGDYENHCPKLPDGAYTKPGSYKKR